MAVALGVGLLLGLERERHKGTGPQRGPAGIRTFALVALLGGLCMRVGGEAVLAVGAAFVGAAAVAGYLRSGEQDPGLTTEVALLVAFLLGALAQQEASLAAALGVAVSILLASRTRMHRIARQTLTEQEVHDGLLFGAAALIILPLVPDEGIGPYEAFNPFTVWRLVVLVMAVNAAGYVGLRLLGPRYGLPLAGFIGGFVSSTATIGVMGKRAVEEPQLRAGAVAAGVSSTVATILFLALVLVATAPSALGELALPLALAGAAALAYAILFAARAARATYSEAIDRGRAFDLRTAVVLALAVSGLLLVSTALEDALGRSGATLAAAMAGFADSQSAAISAASLVAEGRMSAADAVIPVLAGLTTNTCSKAAVALGFGRRAYAVAIWPGLALVLAAAWAGALPGLL